MAATKRKQRIECILAPNSVLPPRTGSWTAVAEAACDYHSLTIHEAIQNFSVAGGTLGHFNPEHFVELWAALLENEQALRHDVWGWAWEMFRLERASAIGREPLPSELTGNKTGERNQRSLHGRFREWAKARLSWHRLGIRKLFSDECSKASARREKHLVIRRFKEWVRKRSKCGTVNVSFCNRLGEPVGCWPHDASEASWDIAGKTAWGDVLCWLTLTRPVSQDWTLIETADAVLQRFGRTEWRQEDSEFLKNLRRTEAPPSSTTSGFVEQLLWHLFPEELKKSAEKRLDDGKAELSKRTFRRRWVDRLGELMRSDGITHAKSRYHGKVLIGASLAANVKVFPCGDDAPDLVGDARSVFEKDRKLSSKELCRRLRVLPCRPWVEWNLGNGITERQLANALRTTTEIRPKDIWIGKGAKSVKGYYRDEFIAA